MKVLLGSLATSLVLLVAGCADSSSDAADDPADPTSSVSQTGTPTGSPTDSPSSSPTERALDFQEIAIISQTAAGGEVDNAAVRLDDQAAREPFLMQFDRLSFGTKIDEQIAAATVPEGYLLLGAVVSIGCDVPPGVNVTEGPDGWFIYPQKVASPLQECFAPVTTVALVAVPA
jgi:hypothetical protein